MTAILWPDNWGGNRSHTSYMTDTINDFFYDFLADGVVSPSIVVRCIFFAVDQEFWVEQVAVSAMADLVDWRRVKVNKDGSGHVFASTGFGEERLISTSVTNFFGIRIWPAIWLQALL